MSTPIKSNRRTGISYTNARFIIEQCLNKHMMSTPDDIKKYPDGAWIDSLALIDGKWVKVKVWIMDF